MQKLSEFYGVTTEFRDVEELCLKWHVLSESRKLPPYEEIGVGSLGRLADDLALIRAGDSGFEISFCGGALQKLFGGESRGLPIEKLAPNYAGAFMDALERARDERTPVATIARRVTAGVVATLELVAFPLSQRGGGTLFLVFLRERASKYDLIDAIHQATDDGLVTLAAWYGPANEIVDFTIVNLNYGATRIFGGTEQGLSWRRLSEIVPAWRENGTLARLSAMFTQMRHEEFETSLCMEDGSRAHLRVSATPMGDLIGMTLTNITALKEREASFRLLFENNPMPMWVCDPGEHRFLSVNDAAVAHYGFSREQFLKLRLKDIFVDASWGPSFARATLAADAFAPDQLWLNRTADHRLVKVQIFARELELKGRKALLMAMVDVTEQQEAALRIAHLAHHDDLTGLANRALFQLRLAQGLDMLEAGGAPLAVLYIDLDGFKYVNDAFGHPTGDKLLVEVAERLRRTVSHLDVVARFGGDEFAVVMLSGADREGARRLATKVIEVIALPFELDGNEIRVGASIGIALAPTNGRDANSLLSDADIALYRAKRDGRGIFCFFQPQMADLILKRRSLEANLRNALRGQELRLYYQPLIDVECNEIVAFEALLRWFHPTEGVVAPDCFIPIAEETGLIGPIGDWALREACREAANWPASVGVCVNLSPVQFKSRGLVPSIASALASSGLSPRRLELEITESVLLAESQGNLNALHQLRGLGARISMDDFGTGYSSLNYLRSFPFDKIKVDRSFIKELPHNQECGAIVRAAAGLARCLGIAVLAEGVENFEQVHHLRNEGYTQMQGFLFGAPAPASDVAELLKTYRERHAA